jgi:hypothetical protein
VEAKDFDTPHLHFNSEYSIQSVWTEGRESSKDIFYFEWDYFTNDTLGRMMVSNQSGTYSNPNLATDINGNVHLVWDDLKSPQPRLDSNPSLEHAILNSNGSIVFRQHISSSSDFPSLRDISVTPDGSLYVIWWGSTQSHPQPSLRISKLDGSGSEVFRDRVVSEGYTYSSVGTVASNGDLWVLFVDESSVPGDLGFIRYNDTTGSVEDISVPQVEISPNFRSDLSICTDAADIPHIVWNNGVSFDQEVFFSKVISESITHPQALQLTPQDTGLGSILVYITTLVTFIAASVFFAKWTRLLPRSEKKTDSEMIFGMDAGIAFSYAAVSIIAVIVSMEAITETYGLTVSFGYENLFRDLPNFLLSSFGYIFYLGFLMAWFLFVMMSLSVLVLEIYDIGKGDTQEGKLAKIGAVQFYLIAMFAFLGFFALKDMVFFYVALSLWAILAIFMSSSSTFLACFEKWPKRGDARSRISRFIILMLFYLGMVVSLMFLSFLVLILDYPADIKVLLFWIPATIVSVFYAWALLRSRRREGSRLIVDSKRSARFIVMLSVFLMIFLAFIVDVSAFFSYLTSFLVGVSFLVLGLVLILFLNEVVRRRTSRNTRHWDLLTGISVMLIYGVMLGFYMFSNGQSSLPGIEAWPFWIRYLVGIPIAVLIPLLIIRVHCRNMAQTSMKWLDRKAGLRASLAFFFLLGLSWVVVVFQQALFASIVGQNINILGSDAFGLQFRVVQGLAFFVGILIGSPIVAYDYPLLKFRPPN